MKKFFVTVSLSLLCSFSALASLPGSQSDLVSSQTAEMVVGADKGVGTEYVYSSPAGSAFTQKVQVEALPSQAGDILYLETTGGEYFKVCCFKQLAINNVTCSTDAPKAKEPKKLKDYTIYFAHENQTAIIVFKAANSVTRIIKIKLT